MNDCFRTETFVMKFRDKKSFDDFFTKYVKDVQTAKDEGIFCSTAAIGDRLEVLDQCQEALAKVLEKLWDADAKYAESLEKLVNA